MSSKFAFTYYRNNDFINKCDEIIITWHRSNTLLDFLKEHNTQRVIIDIPNAKEFLAAGGPEYFDLLAQDNSVKNWVLRLPSLFSEDTFSQNDIKKYFTNTNIPFFFHYYISSYDMLKGIIDLGVSDVYIANELGFNLPKIHKVTQEAKINLRIVPNISQSIWWKTNPLISFWVRPEDIQTYAPHVDVFEIASLDNGKKDQALYKAYVVDKKWFGKLDEIIQGLNGDIDSRFLHPQWAETRVECDKRCLKGGRCRMCYTLDELASSLEKIKVTVGRKEEKEKVDPAKVEKLLNNYYDATKNPIKVKDFLSQIVDNVDKS